MINVEKRNQFAVVSIQNGPNNALNMKLLNELYGTFVELENDFNVKVVVLKGEGSYFSTGADIHEFLECKNEMDFVQYANYGKRLCDKIENFKKPVIAAIHGAALGAGLELALACHMRYVTKSAKLGFPEAKLGIIPGFSGTQRLARFIGEGRALEMHLTGLPITGEEAVRYQLANDAQFDEDLFDIVYEFAETIAEKSMNTIQDIMELHRYTRPSQRYEGMALETEKYINIFKTHDAQEGIRSFIEQKNPSFKDR